MHFGDNVVVDNVITTSTSQVMVIIAIVNEIATRSCKFGNGILEGESGRHRIFGLEICSENASRGVMPFDECLQWVCMALVEARHDADLQRRFRK
ncbi:MAG: hypothetical protein IPH45_08955 [Bacteroidales bacterium]|nr:hypothetical protein [Bacteroidales bacterium]